MTNRYRQRMGGGGAGLAGQDNVPFASAGFVRALARMKPRLSLRMARPAIAAGSLLLGGGWADAAPPPAPRFSAGYMDRTVDPRVDFAKFAAGNWYRTTVIPPDRSAWGGFQQLDERNRALIHQLLEDAAAHPGAAGGLQQKVGDFYATAMDTA